GENYSVLLQFFVTRLNIMIRYYRVLVGVCLDLYCYYSVILFLNFLHRILKLMKKSETGIKQLALFRWSFQLDYHTSSVRIYVRERIHLVLETLAKILFVVAIV